MRLLSSIKDEPQARRFGDYLTTVGVGNQVEAGGDGSWMIWIEHDDDIDRAKGEWMQFQADPSDAKYTVAGAVARKHRAREEKAAQKRRKNYVDVRTSWAIQSWTTPPATLTLIVMCLVAAAVTGLGYWENSPALKYLLIASPEQYLIGREVHQIQNAGEYPQELKDLDAWFKPLAEIRHGQVWRLITPIFIHFGPIHLIFNLFWLRDLGTTIERRKGWLMLVALVLSGAIFGNLGQYVASGPFFGGMSGVVYALFGYVWMKEKFEPWEGLGFPPGTVSIMLIWLVICFTGVLGPIANTAHVVGLIVGMIAGGAKGWWQKTRRRMRFSG